MASKRDKMAAAATAGMFTGGTDREEGQQEEKQESTPKTAKVEKQEEEKKEMATFSVKISADTLKRWRAYTSMNGYGDKGRITEKALVEYMNRHKLPPEQQEKFELLCKL